MLHVQQGKLTYESNVYVLYVRTYVQYCCSLYVL